MIIYFLTEEINSEEHSSIFLFEFSDETTTEEFFEKVCDSARGMIICEGASWKNIAWVSETFAFCRNETEIVISNCALLRIIFKCRYRKEI